MFTIIRFVKFLPSIVWVIICSLVKYFIPNEYYAKDVSEDIVLITGAASGLGRAIALEYAKLGSKLILWDIDEVGLNETKALVKIEYNKIEDIDKKFCLTYLVDVSDKEKIKKTSKLVFDDLNKNRPTNEPERYVTVLVNDTGIYYGLMLHELSFDQIEKTFDINVLAHLWTVRAFLPKMIEHKKGHIVEIASMAGMVGMHKQVDYCASRFSTVGFEESLSIELDIMGLGDKIHTTVICPKYFEADLFTGFDTRFSGLMSAEYVAKEAVMAMRCNNTKLVLPKFFGSLLLLLKVLVPRKVVIMAIRGLGFVEALENIKGEKFVQ